MIDILRRILVVLVMGLCIGLLFIGGSMVKAEERSQWHWPVAVGTLSDVFGSRNAKHFGIDIAAPVGTQVYAVESGRVVKSYDSDTYGKVIFIKQDNGYETVYAHLHSRNVHEGERVSVHQKIGQVGNTGRSFGPHLHFEVHKGSWNIDKTNAINPLVKLDEKKLFAYVTSKVEATVFNQLHVKEDDEIIVHKGDTLFEIAIEYEMEIDHLKSLNGLVTNSIYEGQRLKVVK
ncbi:peptidoglycan DD-metalloendopeptidase family protein [Priestia megaterium]|nr:peptidoglycan DD-metalloendopeptidase family protein [Priestia megaterium]